MPPRLVALLLTTISASAADPINFSRQIRPILSENCVACHGPDEKKREAKLRLDDEASAKATRDGVTAVVPGNAAQSEIIKRIESTDAGEVMPPPKLHKTVSPAQLTLLKAWINQGAKWGKHWSYEVVQRPHVPALKDEGNAIDAFLTQRLKAEGLAFSPAADASAMVRRIALDLTGLPPTLDELKRFIGSTDSTIILPPSSIQEVIDYYLNKPSFGEHWSRLWLDLARYADSSGYPSDQPRTIWAYRDWVIRALNANMPFDQFTIEQIAGDLLVKEDAEQPKNEATPLPPSAYMLHQPTWLPQTANEVLIATAFHRNTMTQNEGGTSDEEFRNAAIIDRVNTTMAVWMGTSMACAQCHTHKYDPITNAEYFQFYAILNQSADADRKDESPVLGLPTRDYLDQQQSWKVELAALDEKLKHPNESIFQGLAAWEAKPKPKAMPAHAPAKGTTSTDAAIPAAVQTALAVPADKRTPQQRNAIRDFYARNVAPELQPMQKRADALRKKIADTKPDSVPIMKELTGKDRRVTKIQLRGNWQALGDEVTEGTPATFHSLAKDLPPNRLALGKWLVDRQNPLTARVMMNRLWEQVFGTGIVRTSEEFGSQGELPFHPELLDWLAAEFMESGWDVKHMLTLMVSSRAYQQSSKVTPALEERDPDNRLLARGPRFRPTGELLRDQALAISGLLSPKMYGPGVRPQSPALGLSTAFGRGNDWTTSDGEDKHRRSVYTEVRRNAPYASFSMFDAPNRETCTLRRGRTNTPLQAFVTLNDPVFIECAQALARRVLIEGGGDATQRLQWLCHLCLARPATAIETQRLTQLLNDSTSELATDKERATKLATDPLGPLPTGMNVVDLAAWTTVANVVMNLDEFVMRR